MQLSFILSFICLFIAMCAFVFHSFSAKKSLFSLGTFSSLAALLALAINLFLQFKHMDYSFGRFLNEPYALLSAAVIFANFIAQAKYRIKFIATLLTPISFQLLLIHLFRYKKPSELIEASTVEHPIYISLHIAFLLISFTLFFLSFAEAITYIVKTRALKSHKLTVLDNELPPLVKLQKILLLSFNSAWIFMTAGILLIVVYSFRKDVNELVSLKALLGYFMWVFYSIIFFLYNFNKLSTRNLTRWITGLFLVLALFLVITNTSTKTDKASQKIEKKV